MTDIVGGVGGGKTADTAKMAACAIDARIAIVPTIASTDAPCSAIAVRYTADGVYQESIFLPRSPDLVVVDSAVVAKAPTRFLVAGVGDALSTWFEARSNLETRSNNYIGFGLPASIAGIALAKACHETLLEALAAEHAVERGALTQAVENIIEPIRCSAASASRIAAFRRPTAFHDGLKVLENTHGFFRGEKVAFGTLCYSSSLAPSGPATSRIVSLGVV